MSDAKIRGEIQPETTFISRRTGNQYTRDAQGNTKRWLHREGRWMSASSTLTLTNLTDAASFTVVVRGPLPYGKSMVEELAGDFASLERRALMRPMKQKPEYLTDFQKAVMQSNTNYNPCVEIQLNKQEDTMSTFTAAELEEKINPTPVTKSTPHMDVRELEQANENAAEAVIHIAKSIKQSPQQLSNGTGTHGILISTKYEKRLMGILRDMRKDQEVILNETAAKLAKVKKALG